MASKSRLTLAALLVGVLGCGDPSGPAPQIPLSIYVVESFERDFCTIELDGTSVFAGAVTTASLSTPAATIHIFGPRGACGSSLASAFSIGNRIAVPFVSAS
jgi:hypothetical protein